MGGEAILCGGGASTNPPLCGRLLIARANPRREHCAILSAAMTDERGDEPSEKE